MKWLSYHVYVYHNVNSYLCDYLSPEIDSLQAVHIIRRFFFVRYWEDGYHLRLRFIPRDCQHVDAVDRGIRESVSHFRADFPNRDAESSERLLLTNDGLIESFAVKRTEYHRDQLYFGETLHSVYSELLNEQTSYVAIQLLKRFRDERTVLFFVLLAIIRKIIDRVYNSAEVVRTVIGNSIRFAEETAKSLGPLQSAPYPAVRNLTTVMENSACTVEGMFKNNNHIRRFVNLVERMHRNLSDAGFIVTHSIHLFCNKTGFSLRDEAFMFHLIRRLHCEQMDQL